MLGSGGHARAVLALATNAISPVRVDRYISNQREDDGVFSRLVFLSEVQAKNKDWNEALLLNGIGVSKNAINRHSLFVGMAAFGFSTANLISKDAYVEKNVELGDGLQIFQMAVIQTGCVIGDNVVVGAGAVVEHDSKIGRGSFVAPGALIMGGVTIENEATIFAGAIVLPGLHIGRGAVVGAGSVILSDVPALEVHAGNPAVRLGDFFGIN